MKTYKPAVTSSPLILQFLLVATALVLAACAGPAGEVVSTISVHVAPATASVGTNQTQQFAATVSGTTNTAVTWQVSSTSASAASIGTINASGLYTAPATVPTGGTVTVTAISQADTTKTGTAVVSVKAPPAVVVTVSPKTATVTTGLTQKFSASVTNTSNTAVTWQVNSVTGGSATTGTISAAGLYTAPATIPTGAVTVKAISAADNTKSDTATVTVTTVPVISITLSPTSSSVQAGIGKQNFTATLMNDTGAKGVTWSLSGTGCSGATCGTLTSATTTSVTYNAPASVPSPAAVTLKATSIADTTKSSTAAITVTAAVGVSIAPTAATINVTKTQNFTATVSNDAQNKGVTWTLTGTGCSGTTCGTLSATSSVSGVAITYTAPTSVPSPAAVTLKAASVTDAARTASATITVVPAIAVTVAPTTANVTVSLTQNFTATVANDAQNKGVTWSLSGTGCSGAACGVLSTSSSASGVAITYTAPAVVPSPATVTVTAKSVADTSKTGAAAVTVIPAVVSGISVAISPKRGGLTLGQNMNFTATVTNDVGAAGVTWSVTSGSLSSQTKTSATYTAPGLGGVVTVTATSIADTTKNASATLGVTDLAGVFTYHNDNNRDGANTQEYALTPSTVTTATFGKLFSCPVDAAVYAQPLWVANITINSVKHNVLLAVTQHDTVYAFDADLSPCQTLWTKSLLGINETFGSSTDVSCADLAPDIGIVGTPVIDPATNTLYLVTKTKTPPTTTFMFTQRIHALSLVDGSEKFGGPTAIAGTINGNSFSAFKNNQRPGLALVNGKVYVGHASHCDQANYQGWLFGYTASDLTVTPDVFTPAAHKVGVESGIWMAGGAPASDASNNVYLITGNGTFDANSTTAPNDDYGDSILKLATAGGISVADYFTPSDQAALNSGDTDLGSGGAAVLVDQATGPHAHLLIGGGKEGIMYLLNRDSLGHISSTDSGVLQKVSTGGAIFSTPAFWQNRMFIASAFGTTSLQSFTFNPSTGLFTTPSASKSPDTYAFPGATPSISARPDGTNGIAWAINSANNGTDGAGFGAAVLRAYDATNLATELWTSSGVTADKGGNAVKFTVPTIANGKVYIGTRGNNTGGAASSTSTPGEIDVYGLKPN